MTTEQKLNIVFKLQAKYPNSHLGGSFGIMLHGYDLKRELTDIDMTVENEIPELSYHSVDKKIEGVSGSGSDFDYHLTVNGVTYDIRVDKHQKWTSINRRGVLYRVTDLATILKYKKEYADKGYDKHSKDLQTLKLQSHVRIQRLLTGTD